MKLKFSLFSFMNPADAAVLFHDNIRPGGRATIRGTPVHDPEIHAQFYGLTREQLEQKPLFLLLIGLLLVGAPDHELREKSWRNMLDRLVKVLRSQETWWAYVLKILKDPLDVHKAEHVAVRLQGICEHMFTRSAASYRVSKPVAGAVFHFADMFLVNMVAIIRKHGEGTKDLSADNPDLGLHYVATKEAFQLLLTALTS